MKRLCSRLFFLAVSVTTTGCGGEKEAASQKATADSAATASVAGTAPPTQAPPPEQQLPQSAFHLINKGGPGCKEPTPEARALHDKYGAQFFCFSYEFRVDGSVFSDIAILTKDMITIGVPVLKYVDLYMPQQNTLRFAVKGDSSYRLFAYRQRDLGNVPPPGKYTDHKFMKPTPTSIDYWWKIRQQEKLGGNSRIRGVAEVVFLPMSVCSRALDDGFLAEFGKRACTN